MSFRSSSPRVLQVLLLLSLLLIALAPSTIGKTWKLTAERVNRERYAELRCMCLKTTSGIHPSNIQTLKVIRTGPHCAKVEVIAKLKNGKEICLDPEAPRIKKMVQKILEGDGSAA
ncbi:platelet basic protein-like [Saccopteryx leptura]|uniref:platelet basic protein-like n=1 Tax=Saccopteryx leptura TaxID=249018 RepID=UPI00339BB59C